MAHSVCGKRSVTTELAAGSTCRVSRGEGVMTGEPQSWERNSVTFEVKLSLIVPTVKADKSSGTIQCVVS